MSPLSGLNDTQPDLRVKMQSKAADVRRGVPLERQHPVVTEKCVVPPAFWALLLEKCAKDSPVGNGVASPWQATVHFLQLMHL